jgi:hypothetical protein
MQVSYNNKSEYNKKTNANNKSVIICKYIFFIILFVALFFLNFSLYSSGKNYYMILKLPFFYKDFFTLDILFILSYIFLFIFCVLSFKTKITKKRLILFLLILFLNIFFYLLIFFHFKVIYLLIISTSNAIICDVVLHNLSNKNLIYNFNFLIFSLLQFYKFFVVYSIFMLN